MIDFSVAKLMLLALIALIVLGPDKLPGAARTAGALLRRVRNGWDSVRSEVERELEVEEIRRAAREAAARAEAAQTEFKDNMQKADTSVAETVAEVKAAVAPEAAAPAPPTAATEAAASSEAQPESTPVIAATEPDLLSEQPTEPDPQQELPFAMPDAVKAPQEHARGGH